MEHPPSQGQSGSTPSSTFGTLEAQLEANRTFLRRLARSLVGDAALADDLVQETALAAIEQGPEVDHSRGWLAQVLRRKVSRHRERSNLRESRQRAAASPESVASHAAAIERRLDLDHLLTDRVRALPKAQARAIGMRYAEGMSIREIAAALGAPEGTIKTRLRRGLARLREDMDRAHGGDGERWLLALAPIAGFQPKLAALGAASGTAATGGTASWALGTGAVAPWIACGFLLAGAGLATFLLRTTESPQLANGPEPVALHEAEDAAAPARSLDRVGAVAQRAIPDAASPAGREPAAAASLRAAPGVRAERASLVLAMAMEESAPACTVHFTFRDGAGHGLSGLATISAPGLPGREVEFRGKPTNLGLKLRVPADAPIEFAGRFDGFEAVRSSFRAGPDGSTLERTIDLLSTLDSAELTLALPPLSEGSPYPDGVPYYVLVEGSSGVDLAMPMRSIRSQSTTLGVGRVPSGALSLRGHTHGTTGIGLDGEPKGYARVFETRLTLSAGERRTAQIDAVRCGIMRLDVTDSRGRSIPATFYFTRNGSPDRMTSGVSRIGSSSSAPRLDGKGPMFLCGIRWVPGPMTLHLESPGYEARSVPVTLRSGEVLEQVVALHRASD